MLPNKKQTEWADCELGVIIHYSKGLMGEVEDLEGRFPEDVINLHSIRPSQYNTDQWMAAAQSMGAKYAIFVANQRVCQGISLWQSNCTPFSLRHAPWQDGKADMVKDFIESCKKYGIRPGIYYQVGYGGLYYNRNAYKKVGTQEHNHYIETVEKSLTELWTQYGDLFEVWFDGGIVPVEQGGPDVYGLLKRYQPQAICFQGPGEHHQNVRWVGNEIGNAPINCWSTAQSNTCSFDGSVSNDEIGIGNPNYRYWSPAETDMGNRDKKACGGGWGWRVGEEQYILSPEHLLECYFLSVGHNSNLLMGMCIDDQGLFPDVKQFGEFGRLIRQLYAHPLGRTQGLGNSFTVELDEETDVQTISIQEDITLGERIREFSVNARNQNGEKLLLSAKCIGHRRLINTGGMKVKSITLAIHHAIDTPSIRDFSIYA